MRRWLKLAWVLIAFAALVASLILFDGRPNSDADILLGYAMLALSFPMGMLMAATLSVLARMLVEAGGYVFTTSYLALIVEWLVFFIVGYLQWFVLVPRVWRWWETRRAHTTSPKSGTDTVA